MTRAVHVTTGIVVALIGLVALIQALTGLALFGANDQPGPGLFPALLAGALTVLGVMLALGYLLAPRDKLLRLEQITFSRTALLRAGGVWLILAVAVGLMPTLGFLVTSVLLVAVLVLGMERLRGIRTVAAMFALPIGIYVVFSVLLSVRLPIGVLGI